MTLPHRYEKRPQINVLYASQHVSKTCTHTNFSQRLFVPMMQSHCVVPKLPCEKNLHSYRRNIPRVTPTPKIFGVMQWNSGRDRDRTGDQLIWNQPLYRWVTRPYISLRDFHAYRIRTSHPQRIKFLVNFGRNRRSISILHIYVCIEDFGIFASKIFSVDFDAQQLEWQHGRVVKAPDSKSGGCLPAGVRIPLLSIHRCLLIDQCVTCVPGWPSGLRR